MNSYKDKIDSIASGISLETNLINSRLGWMLAFQGIAIGISFIKVEAFQEHRLSCVAVIAFCISILVLIGVIGALLSIDNFKKKWETIETNDVSPIFSKRIPTYLGRICSLGIPLLFVLFWSYVLFCMD